jgi:hypothetical protein
MFLECFKMTGLSPGKKASSVTAGMPVTFFIKTSLSYDLRRSGFSNRLNKTDESVSSAKI